MGSLHAASGARRRGGRGYALIWSAFARRLQLEDQDRSFWWEVGSLAVRYQPRSNFPGPMLLIASEEESPRYSHSEEEWRAAAVQPLEILRVPNPHIGFFEHPHMADLMQVLNPRLRSEEHTSELQSLAYL